MNTTPIHAAITELKNALTHVTKHVPVDVLQEHWILAKHSPQAWQELANKYAGDATLAALARLATCLSELEAVRYLLDTADRPPDLTLGKVRRETHGGFSR